MMLLLLVYYQHTRHRYHQLRTALTARSHHSGGDGQAGVSTLEMVIIALGLIAVATLLVAAITTAVTRRTNQIQ